MSETTWYKTDNVAKVFLASHNRRDTRTMRVGATLKERVDSELLQQALLNAIEIRPQFQVRIRRGFFWHYIETTDMLPEVSEESGRPCPQLYGSDYNGVLHYRVTYYGRRINLDMFHALSDGTGLFEFFNVILTEYMKLAHPDTVTDVKTGSGASDGDLTQDSYSQYYGRKGTKRTPLIKAYHPVGRKLPYDQLQFMEITMDFDSVRSLAKEAGVSLTGYIGALMVSSMYHDMPALMRKQPITISIPVNLRNFFPSETSRNFFNSFNIRCYLNGDEDISTIGRHIDVDLKSYMKPENIAEQMDSYQTLERLMFIRMVPLIIKQPVVRYFSKRQNKKISFVLSNMGQIQVDDKIRPYVENFSAFCAHSEMFFTMFSYDGKLRLGMSSAYSDTRFIKNFVRMLTEQDIEVTVNATEVIR
ncbi:MAG: hypothetical protein K6F54_10015 [Lachnospiraceae bacterium]|nr:hypothetical protein [Lachnospiraceae bacterium]